MSSATRVAPRRSRKRVTIRVPQGLLTDRVQRVGPEHFGILSIDCAKARSKMMLCDFYGRCFLSPTEFDHTCGALQAAIDRVRQVQTEHHLQDLVVSIERTGEYHRPVQRAFRAAAFEVRLLHPLATKHFRQVADPGYKTDDTDLAGIHRATTNGFGLIELPLPPEYQQLQLLIRHRRDLIGKRSTLCCQIREQLHAAMPGYANCFSDLWQSDVALLLAQHTGSAAAVHALGIAGLAQIVRQAHKRCQQTTIAKVLAWADTAPPAHPQSDWLRRILSELEDDRLHKTEQILALERTSAHLLSRTPFLLLLAIPGINVVSAADLAGEMGPCTHYANANAITGRAGLRPSRYQSDRVDLADGPLIRSANRRLRAALMQIAENLAVCNQHFRAKTALWYQADKDPRWVRIKIAKTFSRIAYAIVAGQQLFAHACLRQRDYILRKLSMFHLEHDTTMPELLADLQSAVEQLPRSEYQAEAAPLAEELAKVQARRRGPQLLGEILPIVLARLGIQQVQSTTTRAQDLS